MNCNIRNSYIKAKVKCNNCLTNKYYKDFIIKTLQDLSFDDPNININPEIINHGDFKFIDDLSPVIYYIEVLANDLIEDITISYGNNWNNYGYSVILEDLNDPIVKWNNRTGGTIRLEITPTTSIDLKDTQHFGNRSSNIIFTSGDIQIELPITYNFIPWWTTPVPTIIDFGTTYGGAEFMNVTFEFLYSFGNNAKVEITDSGFGSFGLNDISNWDPNSGGTIELKFIPDGPDEYHGNIRFTFDSGELEYVFDIPMVGIWAIPPPAELYVNPNPVFLSSTNLSVDITGKYLGTSIQLIVDPSCNFIESFNKANGFDDYTGGKATFVMKPVTPETPALIEAYFVTNSYNSEVRVFETTKPLPSLTISDTEYIFPKDSVVGTERVITVVGKYLTEDIIITSSNSEYFSYRLSSTWNNRTGGDIIVTLIKIPTE